MFTRSILLPSLAVCALAAPVLLSKHNISSPTQSNPQSQIGYQFPSGPGALGSAQSGSPYASQASPSGFNSPYSSSSVPPGWGEQFGHQGMGFENGEGKNNVRIQGGSRNLSGPTQIAQPNNILQQAGYSRSPASQSVLAPPEIAAGTLTPSTPALDANLGTAPVATPGAARANPQTNPRAIPFRLTGSSPKPAPFADQAVHSAKRFSENAFSTTSRPVPLPGPPAMMPPTTAGPGRYPPATGFSNMTPEEFEALAFAGMTPDYGAAQTLIFPGDANGPDLEAIPLEFLPIADFREVLRFDIDANWVKSRWKRVSTNPGDAGLNGVQGLHGLRVALVTGTQSWDLHGSLTYYFDARQRLQRITFRGWTGNAQRLLQLLTTQYGFQAQPTHLAGFYIAQDRRKTTGGLLMKHPPVIQRENVVEQLAIVLEINDPNGPFMLSDGFRGLIAGSTTPTSTNPTNSTNQR